MNAGVVNGNAVLLDGTIFGGNTAVCGHAGPLRFGFLGGNLISSCNAFDFQAMNTFVTDFAAQYAQTPATGTPVFSGSTSVLTGGQGINVFNFDSARFSGLRELTIVSPADSFVIINVDGFSNRMYSYAINLLGGVDSQHVFYNFYQTTALYIQYIGVEGSVIAPNADVSFPSGVIDGSFFVKSLTGNGQVRRFRNSCQLFPQRKRACVCHVITCPVVVFTHPCLKLAD